jgi:hypothetical protein
VVGEDAADLADQIIRAEATQVGIVTLVIML